jgi:hypothetical protein
MGSIPYANREVVGVRTGNFAASHVDTKGIYLGILDIKDIQNT